MKKLFFSFVLVLIFSFVYSQSGSINGSILTDSNTPIPFATITISNKNILSDKEGRFLSENLANGIYKLKVSCIGFLPFQTNISITNKQTNILVKLQSHIEYR
jgi:hypothetical protein